MHCFNRAKETYDHSRPPFCDQCKARKGVDSRSDLKKTKVKKEGEKGPDLKKTENGGEKGGERG